MIFKKEIRSLRKSFYYSFRGIWFCIKNERNMRIHLSCGVVVGYFAFLFGLSPLESAVLFLTIGAVIASEMVNTAIEALVNLNTSAYDNFARIAKDVAAGAVFVSALTSAAVGAFLFIRPKKLVTTLLNIIGNPFELGLFFVLIAFGIIFVFKPNLFTKPQKNSNYINGENIARVRIYNKNTNNEENK